MNIHCHLGDEGKLKEIRNLNECLMLLVRKENLTGMSKHHSKQAHLMLSEKSSCVAEKKDINFQFYFSLTFQ